jgi:Protein of unknown function (DUF1475)
VTDKTLLKLLFTGILLAMMAVTGWASLHQAVLHWGGLTTAPDRYWTIATLVDAYCGFLTFYAWVFYKENRWLPRLTWFLAIMSLGNMAMAAYALLQVMHLRPDQDASMLLPARNSR